MVWRTCGIDLVCQTTVSVAIGVMDGLVMQAGTPRGSLQRSGLAAVTFDLA